MDLQRNARLGDEPQEAGKAASPSGHRPSIPFCTPNPT